MSIRNHTCTTTTTTTTTIKTTRKTSFPMQAQTQVQTQMHTILLVVLHLLVFQSQAAEAYTPNKSAAVPIIGPLPLSAPLMIASEMTLENPTPLQWKALSSASVLPLRDIIDAAPVVAVMDEASGAMDREVKLPGGYVVRGRYATLAAVMGVRNGGLSSMDESEGSEMRSVRLYGIGRCVITAFKNRIVDYDLEEAAVASLVQNMSDDDSIDESEGVEEDDCDDDNGCEIDWDLMPGFTDDETGVDVATAEPCSGNEGKEKKAGDNDKDNESGIEEDEVAEIKNSTPIVMGEFSMLNDFDTSSSLDDSGRKRLCSPVHAMNALFAASRKVERAHQQRQKLVAGLRAAKVRLDVVNEMMKDFESDEDLFKTLPSFGIDESMNIEECAVEDDTCMTVDEFLSTFKGNMSRTDISEIREQQKPKWEKLKEIENYGLNLYSSFTSISDLTNEAIQQLEPYYSEVHREREAYRHEILSFVAWKAVEGLVDNSEIAWALRCGSTVERLERAYEIMMEHRSLLEKLANQIVAELKECGEECTDLW